MLASNLFPQELAASLIRLVSVLLDSPEGFGSDTTKILECLFVKSLIWSVGACIDRKGRQAFGEYLRMVMEDKGLEESGAHQDFLLKNRSWVARDRPIALLPPDDGRLLHDFRFDAKKGQWQPWLEAVSCNAIWGSFGYITNPWHVYMPTVIDWCNIGDTIILYRRKRWLTLKLGSPLCVFQQGDKFVIPRDATFNSIVVPTMDTVRNEYLIHRLVVHGHHILCTGDTGTGKSVTAKKKLLFGMGAKFSSIMLNFSAQTSANQVRAERNQRTIGGRNEIVREIFVH